MKNTKGAFTLVELIVVITILAILGTIAFISLQGYSADARNSKRISDLNNIASSLNIKLTTGMGMMSLVADSANALTTPPSVGGTGSITGTNYNAGIVNYSALGMKASEFQDPNSDNYVAGVTTRAGGAYQLAASVEQNGSEIAKVVGTYNPRDNGVLSTGVWNTGDPKILTLSDIVNAFRIKVGDVLFDIDDQTLIVTKVSPDGLNLTFTGNISNGSNVISLTVDEEIGLIDSLTTPGTAVTDGFTNLPY